MRDPIKVGDAWIDRAAVTAVLRQNGRILIFLRHSRPLGMDDTLSCEELERLVCSRET